jgi:hypothetical protein
MGYHKYCAEHCAVTAISFTDEHEVVLERNSQENPLIDLKLSEGPPCLFPNQHNSDPRRQDYLLYMSGWEDGCDHDINGVVHSQTFYEADNSPDITEH